MVGGLRGSGLPLEGYNGVRLLCEPLVKKMMMPIQRACCEVPLKKRMILMQQACCLVLSKRMLLVQ